MRIASLLLAVLAQVSTAEAAPTRMEVGVLAVGAKFMGRNTGGARVEILDERGQLLAAGVTEGSTGNTGAIMNATWAHLETTLGDNALARFELDLSGPTKLTVRATGPLDYPDQQRTSAIELLAMPGEHLVGGRAVLLGLSGLVLDPETVDLGADGGHAQVTFMMACGCPITPEGLWDFADYRLVAEVETGCRDASEVAFEHAGEGPRYRVQVAATDEPLTAVRARAISRVHPQLSGRLTLWESQSCD